MLSMLTAAIHVEHGGSSPSDFFVMFAPGDTTSSKGQGVQLAHPVPDVDADIWRDDLFWANEIA
jgi:hypothetical protein